MSLKLGPGLRLPLDVVTEATAIVATRGAGKSSTAAVLVEEALASKVPTVVVDWTGVFWGLRSSADGTGPGLAIYVLGGPHGDLPLEPHAGGLVADLAVESGQSFVLDLSDFNKSQMRRFAADFLERLYDRKARARTTLLLVIDEAHELAPQSPRGGFKGDAARLIGAMEQTVALGRSRGIGAILITQRTQALNKAVLDLIETLIVMRMLSPRAVNAVREWITIKNEDDEAGVLASLPELPTGTAWVWSPLRGILKKAAIRRIRTFDSYRTPKPGETLVEPQERKEVDLDALGEQMRASAERARADDPVALRKQIRDLTARLNEASSRPAEPVEPQIVEVATLPPGHLDALRAAHELADRVASDLLELRANLGFTVDDLDGQEIAVGRPSPAAPVSRASAPGRRPAPPAAATPTAAPARAAVTAPASTGNGDGPALTAGERETLPTSRQRILDTLAWFETVGIHAPKRAALAPMAGTKTTSGGFKNNLGALRTAGLIDYPEPNRVHLTPDGRTCATVPHIPPTPEALQDAVLTSLPTSRSALLRTLIENYPYALPRERLADAVGVPVSSGGFKNNLGALRTLELIDYPAPGDVVALPVLFLEERA